VNAVDRTLRNRPRYTSPANPPASSVRPPRHRVQSTLPRPNRRFGRLVSQQLKFSRTGGKAGRAPAADETKPRNGATCPVKGSTSPPAYQSGRRNQRLRGTRRRPSTAGAPVGVGDSVTVWRCRGRDRSGSGPGRRGRNSTSPLSQKGGAGVVSSARMRAGAPRCDVGRNLGGARIGRSCSASPSVGAAPQLSGARRSALNQPSPHRNANTTRTSWTVHRPPPLRRVDQSERCAPGQPHLGRADRITG
jgi:hypothetical protein